MINSQNKTNEFSDKTFHSSSESKLNYYENEWKEKNLNCSDKEKKSIVVFALKGMKIDTIIGKNSDAVILYPSNKYKDLGNNEYEVNTKSYNDLKEVFKIIKEKRQNSIQIIYLWTMRDSGLSTDSFLKKINSENSVFNIIETNFDLSIYYIFNLLKCILELKIKEISKMLLFYKKDGEIENFFYEVINCYGKSLGYVIPNLEFSTVELKDTNLNKDIVTNELCNEEYEREIFYHNKKRYIKTFKNVELKKTLRNKLKTKQTYLITGGTGSLGVLFSEYLAKKYKANLILIGRSEFNSDKKEIINKLENEGSKAIYLQADVSNINQMHNVIEEAKKRFGEINGVIHAAGMMSNKLINQKDINEFKQILQSKIKGTIVLDEVTKNEPLDFMIFFSSTSATLGDFGQCDYAIGNRFLDSYSRVRNNLKKENYRQGKTININWPLWRNGGMHQEEGIELLYLKAYGMGYLEDIDGIQAFEDIINSDKDSIMVLYGNTKKIEESIGIRKNVKKASQVENQYKKSSHNLEDKKFVKHSIEMDIKDIAAKILKINADQMELDVNIGEYGFDSISLRTFSEEISNKYDIEILPTVFFSINTIGNLTNHLLSEYGTKVKEYYNDTIDYKNSKVSETAKIIDTVKKESKKPNSNLTPLRKRFSELGLKNKGTIGVKKENEPIAIIGIDGIFPGSKDLNEFWENIKNEKDLITLIPSDRWNWKRYYSENSMDKNKSVSNSGGFISDVDKFDAQFFNISPREAELMDPQQRLLLQTIWKTTEDAGYKASELSGKNVGVFIGFQFGDYKELLEDLGEMKPQVVTGNAHALLSNRISYYMNFLGPSESIDTACSSSLVAIHRAINSINNGESEVAFAGGVSLMLSPKTFLSSSELGVLSPDNHCKTFDKSANGYVKGEGVGAVLLKPLSKAIRDHDNIHAIIKGSAENHGGRANSLTAPNPDAQAAVLVKAYEEAKMSPDTISYIEAHGTGTELGDPIEIEGLKKAFNKLYKINKISQLNNNYCGIGSVKTNIGHLEPAAGIASILKVVMSLKNKKIPASINLKELNPYINLDNSPFYIVNKTKRWDRITDNNGRVVPRRAGVSSFGFGGANAHIVLEEYEKAKNDLVNEKEEIIILSAKDSERLKEYASNLISYLNVEEIGDSDLIIKDKLNCTLKESVSVLTNVEKGYFNEDEILEEYGVDAYKCKELEDILMDKFKIKSYTSFINPELTINDIAEYLSDNYYEYLLNVYDIKLNNEGKENYDLSDIAFTLQVGREAMDERLAIIAKSTSELIDGLQQYVDNKIDKNTNVFSNNIKKNKYLFEIFDDDEDTEEMICNWVNKKKLDKIARLWVSGYDVDWNIVNRDEDRNRISLPTYPFKKKRFWIPSYSNETSINGDKNIGKLIDSIKYDLSLDCGITFTKKINNESVILRDHVIKGKNIFPGVGYLEMAYEATRMIKGNSKFKISNVFWLNPLVLDEEEKNIYTVLKKQNGKLVFEVKNSSDSQREKVYSKGEIQTYADDLPKNVQKVLIQSIKNRCLERIESEDIYKKYKESGVNYGPFFRGIVQAYKNNNEVLGVIQVSTDNEAELGDYTLHPTLLDSALQLIGCIKDVGNDVVLPFSVGNVEFLSPLKSKMYVYVRPFKSNSYNIDIIDESGNISVRIGDFVIKSIKDKFKDLYYETLWVKKDLQREIVNGGKPDYVENNKSVLIIFNTDGENVAKVIKNKYTNTIMLKLGDKNIKYSDNMWEIKSNDAEAIKDFILKTSGIKTIYFLGGIQTNPIDIYDLNKLESIQQSGVISLFRLVKLLQQNDEYIELKIVTNNVYDVKNAKTVLPNAASIHGFAKSLAKENHKLNITMIDIDMLSTDNVASEEEIDSLISPIFYEESSKTGEVIVYRNNERYEQIIEAVNLPEVKETSFKHNGVYLIIGGAGGIGLELSSYLSKKVNAQLLLVGRSELSKEKLQKIEDIKKLGGNVTYYRADVTKEEDMRNVISNIKSNFGYINGVFFSAIVSVDKTVQNLTEDEFCKALNPKIIGSEVMLSILKNEKLDFMAFFSSTSSVVGTPGQSNYVSGLSFQDAFAHYIQKFVDYPIKVFNWGLWGLGSSSDEKFIKTLRSQGIYTINVSEGMETIERVLNQPKNQIFILRASKELLKKININKKDESEVLNTTEVHNTNNQVNMDITYESVIDSKVDNLTVEEKLYDFLKTLLSNILKMDKESIDNEVEFSEIGVDSLLGLEFQANLENSFGELPSNLLYENKNINELVKYFLDDKEDKLAKVLGIKEVEKEEIIKETESDMEETVALGLVDNKEINIELPVNLESSFININDYNAKFEVMVKGEGEPVLIIPGFAVTMLINSYQIEELSKKYKVISVNLPGHGKSDIISDLTFSGIAKVIMSILDKLGIDEPINVIGASFGGMIAQGIAYEFQGRIKTLTLISSFTVSKFEGIAKYFSFIKSVSRDFEVVKNTSKSKEITDNVDYNFELYKASQVRNSEYMMKYLDLMKQGMTTKDMLKDIKIPTLIMCGSLDTVIDPHESEFIKLNIKDNKYVEIYDGGHFIGLTHKDIVNDNIISFLNEYKDINSTIKQRWDKVLEEGGINYYPEKNQKKEFEGANISVSIEYIPERANRIAKKGEENKRPLGTNLLERKDCIYSFDNFVLLSNKRPISRYYSVLCSKKYIPQNEFSYSDIYEVSKIIEKYKFRGFLNMIGTAATLNHFHTQVVLEKLNIEVLEKQYITSNIGFLPSYPGGNILITGEPKERCDLLFERIEKLSKSSLPYTENKEGKCTGKHLFTLLFWDNNILMVPRKRESSLANRMYGGLELSGKFTIETPSSTDSVFGEVTGEELLNTVREVTFTKEDIDFLY